MPDDLSSLEPLVRASLQGSRATLIRGVCSLCRKEVRGAGADEFEAIGDAEASHFHATDCRGEPIEIVKGIRRDGREVWPKVPRFSALALAPCGCPEERHALGLPCPPPPLPAPATQMMRIAERFNHDGNGYDPRRLNMEANVFDDVDEMLETAI